MSEVWPLIEPGNVSEIGDIWPMLGEKLGAEVIDFAEGDSSEACPFACERKSSASGKQAERGRLILHAFCISAHNVDYDLFGLHFGQRCRDFPIRQPTILASDLTFAANFPFLIGESLSSCAEIVFPQLSQRISQAQ